MKYITLCLALMFSAASQAERYEDPIDSFVIANKLNMRTAPKAGARLVRALRYGQRVQILARQDKVVKIGGKEGRWAKIRSKGKRGWVFDYFLASGNMAKQAKQVTNWKHGDLDFCIKDDGCWGYKMNRDGSFQHYYEQRVSCLNGASECCPYGFEKSGNRCVIPGHMKAVKGVLCPVLKGKKVCQEFIVSDVKGKRCPDEFLRRGVCRVR